MTIPQAGSPFAPDLENIAELGNAESVGNVVDSSRLERIATNRPLRVDSTRFETRRLVSNRHEGDDSSRIVSNRQISNASFVAF